MRQIRGSGSMSGEGKRSDAHKAQATAPLLDSTGRGGAGVAGNIVLFPRIRGCPDQARASHGGRHVTS